MKYGKEIIAYCYASGVIKFRSANLGVPEGAISIARGPGKVIRDKIGAVCRHGYDGKTLLVPGVPEAQNQAEAMGKFEQWLEWCRPSINLGCRMAELSIYGDFEKEEEYLNTHS